MANFTKQLLKRWNFSVKANMPQGTFYINTATTDDASNASGAMIYLLRFRPAGGAYRRMKCASH